MHGDVGSLTGAISAVMEVEFELCEGMEGEDWEEEDGVQTPRPAPQMEGVPG